MTPIHVACNWGNITSVKTLLYLNPNSIKERQELDGRTPLICAAANGHEELVELLLSQPHTAPAFLLHDRSSNQWTALHYAAAKGKLKVICILHQKGAFIDAKARFVGTPLCVAVKHGHERVVKYLVNKAGANINIDVEDTSMSPLGWACQQNHPSIAKFLLNHGAELSPEILHWGADRPRILRLIMRERPSREILCSVHNGRTIFDYDWLDDLLEARSFYELLKYKQFWKPWNLLALICHRYYFQKGDMDTIALFQLSDEVQTRQQARQSEFDDLSGKALDEMDEDEDSGPDDMVSHHEKNDSLQHDISDENEFDLNMATPENFSWILHAAVSMPPCPQSIISFLARLFPNQVAQTHRGRTPLHIACRTSAANDDVINSLLAANPCAIAVREETPAGHLPLSLALLQRKLNLIPRLVNEYPRGLIELDSQGFNTMSIAALYADLDAMYLCLRSLPTAIRELQR